MYATKNGMWRYREPPRMLQSEEYKICERRNGCGYGEECICAHSLEELEEWKQRGVLTSDKIKKLWETQQTTLAGTINAELISAANPESVLVKDMPNITVYSDKKPIVSLRNKKETIEWEFTVNTYKDCLAGVAFLNQDNIANFSVTGVSWSKISEGVDTQFSLKKPVEEWHNPDFDKLNDKSSKHFVVKVQFKTSSYGVFRQKLVFSFKRQQYLYRDLVVLMKQEEIVTKSTDLFITESKRWESLPNVEIVRSKKNSDGDQDKLLAYYTRPSDITTSTNIVETHQKATPSNYKEFSHSLLYIEETEQYHQLFKLNLSGQIQFTRSYTMESVADDTTSYAQQNELFARLPLESNLSEDTVQGRILLQYVNFVLLTTSVQEVPNKVFECSIVERGKDFMILNIPANCVKHEEIKEGSTQKCQIQFVINRHPFCEMHYALDRLKHRWFLFPDTKTDPTISWNPTMQWTKEFDEEESGVSLNLKQKEGSLAITSKSDAIIPAVLLIGPFGTGKTLTLARSIIHLLNEPNTRILVCTHSNSAADLYVKDYLHPLITRSRLSPNILRRVVYKHRWVSTLSDVVKKYAMFDESMQSFRDPTLDDLTDSKVVITTLASCFSLIKLKLESGFFTHIMIDEAAQAKELETLIPLVLADRSTKIIMAGDHMQMNPEVCSQLARKYGLHDSLFERLAHLYQNTHYCKILLNANYRSHEELVKYSSKLFYNGQLKACGRQLRHPQLHPLAFLAARGEGKQQHGTGYCNISEVHETVDFLSDLIEHWPKEWGEIKENSIGVVVPYTDQVHMLRNALRQRDPRLRNVAVERVNNVQGKEFRVIVINTVRTYHSCYNVKEEDADYGFLSNPKLLNTAITRAQSLVVIVGDPFSLCTVGKCRNLWIKFLEECHKHQSLHGVTFDQIQYYLDIMDIQKQYKLNPAAQSFIPKYAQQQQIAASYAGQPLIQQQLTSTSQNLYPTVLQGSFSAVPVFQTNSYQQYAYYPTSSLQSIAGYPQAQLQSQYQTLNGTTFTAPVGSQLYNNQLSATNLMASPSTAASISVSLPQKTVVSQHMVVTNRTSSPPLDFLSDVMGDWKKFTTT